MDRRGFIGSLLGLAATAALPKPALAFLERTEAVTDAEFVVAAKTDSALIDLIEMRIREAYIALAVAIDKDLYENGTQNCAHGIGGLF